MNDILKTIKNRRAVRKYLPDQLEDSELNEIVQAGLWAPSAVNRQNWHITIIKSKSLLDTMNHTFKEWIIQQNNPRYPDQITEKDYHVFFHAPTVALISHDAEDEHWGPTNASLLTENMTIAATALAIGSCIVGFPVPMLRSNMGAEIRDQLSIPAGYIPHICLTLGYPDPTYRPEIKSRREDTVSIV